MQIADKLPSSVRTSFRRIKPSFLLRLLAIFIPLIVTWLVISLHLRANFSTYVPIFGNDPISYWHYTLTFSQVGFNGGYYAPNEMIAPFAPIHFDVIGPMFPILYGSVAHFTGWGWTTGIIFNAVLVTASLTLFIYVLRPNKTQSVMIALLAGTSWMLILYLPSLFQESLHFAIGITAAASFYALIDHPTKVSRPVKWAIGVFIIASALVRISWCVLLPPYFILSASSQSRRTTFWALLKTAIITLIMLQLLKYISPPSNNSVLDSAAEFQSSLLNGAIKVFSLLANNLIWYGVYGRDNLLNVLILSQVIGLLAALAWRRRNARKEPLDRETLFHLSNLGGITISGMFLYLAWGFDRVFAPHLLLSALLFIALRHYRPVRLLVVTNVLTAGIFLTTFSQYWSMNFAANPADFTKKQAEMAQYIVHDPTASNPWCNTLLLDIGLYDSRVLTIPAGIGVAYVMKSDQLQFPLKSRYVLFDGARDGNLYLRLEPHLNLRLLAHSSIGDLYLNEDTPCT